MRYVSNMGLGRRKIRLEDKDAWVFNRMADVYDARPPYPADLIDAVVQQARGVGARVLEIGAGIGHLAIPLAERGLDVIALEPAIAMLEKLRRDAEARHVSIRTLHATAEKLPMDDASVDLIVIADAFHFLDAELTAHEIRRVLVPNGALVVITCELGDTPFMHALEQIMAEAAPRRPRSIEGPIAQLSALTDVPFTIERVFEDATPVDPATLERILRSISFIGPAMNPARFEAFRVRVHALKDPAWARRFTFRAGVSSAR